MQQARRRMRARGLLLGREGVIASKKGKYRAGDVRVPGKLDFIASREATPARR